MTYLTGKCLLAMPSLDDDYFNESLIYICSHNEDGAFGFVINKTIDEVSFEDVLRELSSSQANYVKNFNVHRGGPLDKVRGFVLHSTDYMSKDSVVIDEKIAVSSCVDIITDIAKDKGPEKNLVVLGYASWSANQLENEIKNNFWLVVDADYDLLFLTPNENKINKAFDKLGVNPVFLSAVSGSA